MRAITSQEAFTKSCLHMLRPDFSLSVDLWIGSQDQCLYAGPNGNSCAIGVLLPRDVARGLDKLRQPNWVRVVENKRSIYARQATRLLKNVDSKLLERLQIVHDLSSSGGERRSRLERIAEDFELQMPDGLQ